MLYRYFSLYPLIFYPTDATKISASKDDNDDSDSGSDSDTEEENDEHDEEYWIKQSFRESTKEIGNPPLAYPIMCTVG